MTDQVATSGGQVAAPGEQVEPLGGVRALVALGSLAACAGSFITVESMPIGLLPQIAAAMHTSLATTGLLVTIYALVVVGVTVPLSKATARMPRRTLLGGAAAVVSVGCLGCVLAPDFATLLAARVLTATGQAVFWAVGPVEATRLVRQELHGRAVTAVFGGSALGMVLGVPFGTWLGHTAGWRVAFAVMVAVGLVLVGAVLLALPHRRPAESRDARGSAPQRVRYRMVLLATCLAVTGFYSVFTYANPFLVRVGGISRGSVALVLLGSGLAATVGLGSGGALYARHPRATLAGSVSLVAAAELCLFGFGAMPGMAPTLLLLASLGQSVFTVSGQLAVITLGPENGSAWYSTAFNVGIASGPLLGGLTLDSWDIRATPLAGAAVAAVAVLSLGSSSHSFFAVRRRDVGA